MTAAIIEMPGPGFYEVSFDLMRFTASNRQAGGLTDVLELAEPRWVAKFTTGRLVSRAELVAVRAFWDDLAGGLQGWFVAYDPAQVFPIAYPKGFAGLARLDGTPFDGATAVDSLPGVNQHQMVLSYLPPGFRVARGDLVELRQGTRRGLYRVMAAVVASAVGTATLTVKPRIIPGLFAPGQAIAHFDRPSCVMTPDPASWSLAVRRDLPPASFGGIQVVF